MSQISTLLAALEAKAETVKDEILQWADTFGAEVINDIEIGVEELAGIALNAVIAEAPKVVSGTEKFGNAVASVVQTVEAQGKTIAIQTAQMSVQQAVAVAQDVAKAAAIGDQGKPAA